MRRRPSRALRVSVASAFITQWAASTLAQDAASASASLEAQCVRFDAAQNASLTLQWELLAPGSGGPYTRISHTAVALAAPARVLIVGGMAYESAQPVVVNTTVVYDPQSDAFKLPVDQIQSSATVLDKDDVFSSPASRVEHATALAGPSAVLLFGGQNSAFLNDLWRLCVAANSAQAKWDQFVVPASDTVSLAATPDPRVGHSLSVVFENASFTGAVVFGGVSDSYTEIGTQLHLALVPRASVQGTCGDRSPRVYWRKLVVNATAARPDARAYHAAAPVSRIFSPQRAACLLLYGGKSSQTNLIYGDVWRLCPAPTSGSLAVESQTYQWEQLRPIGSRGPGPRYGAAIVFVDEGKVAIAGGSYSFPSDFLSDLWEFNINATQWLALRFAADFSPPRRGHSITLLGERLFLFGGRDRYAVVSQRVQIATYAAPFCATGLKITLCDATSTYVCVPCPAGFFLEAGTRNCLPCGAGAYSAQGAAACTLCPTGTFNTLTTQTSVAACVACPAGSSSSAVGATQASTCLPCTAGTFAASTGTSSCVSCAAGSFSAANASACSLCGVGEWSPQAAAACSKCAAGSYNPRNGSAVCFPCPGGFYSDAGAANCTACPVKTFSASVSTAGVAGCAACPALMVTNDVGSAMCVFCAAGTTIGSDGSTCQPCPRGSYSGGVFTGGACLPCPLHLYSNSTSGVATCVPCPSGTFTSSTGATAPSDCRVCSPTAQYFDGSNCRSCPPGSFMPNTTIPSCEACPPGFYTSTTDEASLAAGCQTCPTMAVAAQASASSCVSCPDGSFAMAAWRTCVPCAPSFLSLCPVGPNGLSCSGNGACFLRGCDCVGGWTGGDCSVPIDPSVASASAAVLYFPYNQSYTIRTRASSSTSFSLRVRRSGSAIGELRAQVQVKTSNTTAIPSSAFPASVVLASGVEETTLSFSVASFAGSVIGSNCRSVTLELVNTGSGGSVSAVAADTADRVLTLLFDDDNGPSGGGGQARSSAAQYSLASPLPSPPYVAAVVLDRTVATKVKLQPPSSIQLRALPLNVRIAIDPIATEKTGAVDLLPATIALLQTAYSSSPLIRVGLLNPDTTGDMSASVYLPLPTFLSTVRRVVSSSVAAANWQWLADRLSATNATQWATEDQSLRRFVVAYVAASSLTGDATVFAAALRQYGAFAILVFPPGQSFATSLPSDVVKLVTLTSLSEMPQRIVDALSSRDAAAPTNVAASIIADPDSLVQAGTTLTVSIASTGLPIVDLTLAVLPVSVSTSAVKIAVSGYASIMIVVSEPGASCYPQPSPESLLPMDENVLSGWIGLWHLLTESEWSRQWKAPMDTPTSIRRFNSSSLLRSTRTSVVALTPSGSGRRVVLTRTIDGGLVAPGLNLIVKAYVRHSAATVAGGVSCGLRLLLTPANASVSPIQAQRLVTTRPEWVYVHLSSAVPFEVSSMQLQLDCNTTQAVPAAEWTHLGVFPDPQIACLCPRGFFYDNGACLRCPAGSYCVAGIKRECPLGYFSFGKADHCEKCRDGWICIDGLVRLCQAGTFASPGSSCSVCSSGYACRNGKQAICPRGTFSRVQASDCELCPPGTISTAEGSSSCALCPLGLTSNFARDHCVSCLAGETTTLRGQHACASCAATAFLSRAGHETCVASIMRSRV